MLKGGFVIIHRKIIDWEWYKNANTRAVFLHLIFTCNHEERKFMGEIIKPGERVASYATLAKELGLSTQNVRTAVNHLKSTNELASRTNHQYTVFTVVNYTMYQAKQQTKQHTINKRLTNDQQTTNNNGTIINNNKQRNNNSVAPSEPEFHINEGGDF